MHNQQIDGVAELSFKLAKFSMKTHWNHQKEKTDKKVSIDLLCFQQKANLDHLCALIDPSVQHPNCVEMFQKNSYRLERDRQLLANFVDTL